MTTKDRLHLIVERLPEPEAEALLEKLEAEPPVKPQRRVPKFIGSFESERGDLSTRYKEIREAEFGR